VRVTAIRSRGIREQWNKNGDDEYSGMRTIGNG